MAGKKRETIAILDFGGQYTQLIAKRVRQSDVYSEIFPCETSAGSLKASDVKGIILSGGPDSVYQKGAPSVDKGIYSLGIPVLGICYGMQLTAFCLGGEIVHGKENVREYGETEVFIEKKNVLLDGVHSPASMWMSHGDSVSADNLPEGFEVIARTMHHTAAIADNSKKIYGVQFHPEVTHSADGQKIIDNFVHGICGCSREWTMGNYIEECKKYIQETVGKNDVICFVSGGVDSAFVAAVLAQTQDIGRVYAIYIEALMRKDETKEVQDALKNAGIKDLIIYKGEDEFIEVLRSLDDPEDKRRAIGNLFGRIQEKMISRLNLDPQNTFLAQGTLYTDLIESGHGCGTKAAVIKSHHNVGCEFIERLKEKGRLVEPNRLIFKDEVRKAAKEIGLPKEIYMRQPFPGPGLGIRIVNGDSRWIDDDFKAADEKAQAIALQFGLKAKLTPVKTVGVQGDGRTYSFVCVLQGPRDWKNIRDAARLIPMEVTLINRVVYLVNPDVPKNGLRDDVIPNRVTKSSLKLLQDIDHDVRMIIRQHGFEEKISQTIVVLFASDLYGTGNKSVCIRAVLTDDFMTVSPVSPVSDSMSWGCLDDILQKLKADYSIQGFVLDVTDKPPATTCWE